MRDSTVTTTPLIIIPVTGCEPHVVVPSEGVLDIGHLLVVAGHTEVVGTAGIYLEPVVDG